MIVGLLAYHIIVFKKIYFKKQPQSHSQTGLNRLPNSVTQIVIVQTSDYCLH
jgi:hypothetical protein